MARLRIDSLGELARFGRVLVVGIGGGGDSLGALALLLRLRSWGADAVLGNAVWERFVLDPFPGPIPVEQLFGAEGLGRGAALVDARSFVRRHGLEIRPQIVVASEVLGERAVFLDMSGGERGFAEALEEASERLGAEAVLGVDVGGDVLARGCEEGLWSPLADSIALSALQRIRIPSVLAVLGPGVDGELSPGQVLERIAEIAAEGGLVEVCGLSRRELRLLEGHLDRFASEASKMPFLALRGSRGEIPIRGGSRRVELSPLSASLYVVETDAAYRGSAISQIVRGSESVYEARRRLNDRCLYTELDLEEDLQPLIGAGEEISGEEILEIRSRGLSRLKSAGCRPLECSQ